MPWLLWCAYMHLIGFLGLMGMSWCEVFQLDLKHCHGQNQQLLFHLQCNVWELCWCCLELQAGKHASQSFMRAPLVCQCESMTSSLVAPFSEVDEHPDLPIYTGHNASHLLGMSKSKYWPCSFYTILRGLGLYLASQVQLMYSSHFKSYTRNDKSFT